MSDKRILKGIFAVIISLLLMNLSSEAQVPEQDSLALVALYDSTAGVNWTNNTNWMSGPVQNWFGITVSQDRVTAIQLGQNNLIGTIPIEIGSLTELDRLNLRNNQITGEIPLEIGNFTKLTQLLLENNQLTGIIPTEIGNLVDLEQLDLHFNDLSGTIPPGIYNMTNLINLILFGNELTGTLPTEIGNLVNLESLELYSNLLSGEIPAEIGNLTKLRRLLFAINQFTGPIPVSIGNLINLTNLQLNGNQLTGTIPPEIGNLINLNTLLLSNNQLTGTIPPEMGNLININTLMLNSNQLTGSIPPEIGNLIEVELLLLRFNQLSGQIPVEIGNLTKLTQMKLSFNQLTGSIPVEMGNLVNMRSLELHVNQLSGAVPAEMGNMTKILALELNNNQLSGAIPVEFTNYIELDYLALHSNMLEDLPDLSALDSLNEIRIYSNKFTFEDIEPNINIPTILYSPQDSVGSSQDTTMGENESLTLSVTVGGTANQYQWMKDDVDIPGADSSSYLIESITAADSGVFVCRISNTIATELTLFSRPVNVKVPSTVGFFKETDQIIKIFKLYQNFPNPFNPSTTIEFNLPHTTEVSLKVFNVLGEEVAHLVSEGLPAGKYRYNWDANGIDGIASGIYIYQLKAGDYVETKKMVLMR